MSARNMGKQQFTHVERYAVFSVHGERCYLCKQPIDLQTMEIDHILPEWLLDSPTELARVLRFFGLPENFNVQSYANWMPACGPCNNRKRSTVFSPSPCIQVELQIASQKARAAQTLAAEIVHRQTLTKALNTISRAAEAGVLTDSDLEAIRSLALFHLQHRTVALNAQPIRLAPNVAMFFEIAFCGGCLDGSVMRGGTPEFEANKVWWLLRTVGPLIAMAEEENQKLSNYLTWRQPAPEIVALANERRWSKEEQRQRMKYHIYHVTHYEFAHTTIKLIAEFQDIN